MALKGKNAVVQWLKESVLPKKGSHGSSVIADGTDNIHGQMLCTDGAEPKFSVGSPVRVIVFCGLRVFIRKTSMIDELRSMFILLMVSNHQRVVVQVLNRGYNL